jgi:protein-disulfide isomerase/uncharacterized membrane protein
MIGALTEPRYNLRIIKDDKIGSCIPMPTLRKTGRKITPLPFPVYFWTVTAVALSGLLDAIYLSVSHYRVYTDIGYSSFCAISQSINCDTVSQSPYSIFLGIPIPIWGVIGYAFILMLLPLAWSKSSGEKHLWTLLLVVSLAFSIYSIILALISTFLIHSYCVMCIVNYGINFMLLFYTYLIRQRFEIRGVLKTLKNDISCLWHRRRYSFALFAPFSAVIIWMLIFFPVYWTFEPPELSAYIPHGITKDGHPWIGAENPKIEIVEFTDYQCFQCNKMHFFLRQMMVKYPGKIKLIHRHFPMDGEVNPIVKEPLHPGSGKLAMLAIYAANEHRFWQMSDLLFSIVRVTPKIRIKELADQTGLDFDALSRAVYNHDVRSKLIEDIADGLKLGVNGTPSFVIDGKLYRGQIPPELLKKSLDE